VVHVTYTVFILYFSFTKKEMFNINSNFIGGKVMTKTFKKFFKENLRKLMATLVFAEPGLTEEDYVYLNSIIDDNEYKRI